MCAPDSSNSDRTTKRIIVSGAGPAGLLAASLLLARNKEQDCSVTYNVTLIDSREDYGLITKTELTEKHRSWMLALADHGMDAIKMLPDLYTNYVKGEGIQIQQLNLYLGTKKIEQSAADTPDEEGRVSEAFVVDRNFIVASLARYVKDTHCNDPHFTSMYNTSIQYVDYTKHQVYIRDTPSQEECYIPYDLLLGCDGVRSTVREALIKRHSNFTCNITDIFQEFKAVHVDLPKEVNGDALTLLPDILPYCQGIALPESNGKVNISIGLPRSSFDSLPKELKSDDYIIVAEYLRQHFAAFVLVDYEDFAKQWCSQRWNQTGMVHCNFYHSVETGVLIMGDAAHATSPSIGMGMNTALRDAQVFCDLLKEHKDDLSKTLPAFSEARVKEGNALSDLAYYLYSLNKTQQTIETLHMVVRTFLHSKLPSLIAEHPQSMIGRRGVALSEVYDRAVKLGIMKRHRATNDKVRMEYFEKTTGMVTANGKRSIISRMFIGGVSVAMCALLYQQKQVVSM